MLQTICEGIKKNGRRCTYKAKVDGFCLIHKLQLPNNINNNDITEGNVENRDECESSSLFDDEIIATTECSICYELLDKSNLQTLCCNHMFHKTCIDKWLVTGGHTTCPICRTEQPDSTPPRHHQTARDRRRNDNRRRNINLREAYNEFTNINDMAREHIMRWFDEYDAIRIVNILEAISPDILGFALERVLSIVIQKLEEGQTQFPDDFIPRLMDISYNVDTHHIVNFRTRIIELVCQNN